MANITRSFTGNLNLDDHPLVIPAQDYIDAMNLTIDSHLSAGDGVRSNIQGNQKVPFTLVGLNSENRCIGAWEDKLRNRVIYFVYNQFGYHTILKWTKGDASPVKIFQSKSDAAGADILKLQLPYFVKDIHVFHRDIGGDLLYWNDRVNPPGQLNIDDFVAGKYTPATEDLIRQQRNVPRTPIKPYYTTDATNFVNNFKRKLFQYTYCWGYSNDQVSTIAPPSKVIVPVDAYSVDVDTDPSKNNVVILPVVAGPADCTYIQIFGRESIGESWGDWFVIDILLLSDYAITPNSTYSYRFVNDTQYVEADQDFMDLVFDNSADLCDAQAPANGNYLLQAGVTDGYDVIKRSDVNVQLTSDFMDTTGNNVSPTTPTILVKQGVSGGRYYIYFEIGSSVGDGSVYRIKFTCAVYSGNDLAVDLTYVANGSDTAHSVATAIVALLTTQIGNAPFHAEVSASVRANVVNEQNPPNAYTFQNIITSAVPKIIQSGGTPCHPWGVTERWGLVYKDIHGKSNGAVSWVTSEDDPSDFSVKTGDFSFDATTGNPKLPVVLASINSHPPSWAYSYEWVVGFTISKFLHYITAEVQEDAQYNYFCIENLNVFKTQNSGFVPSYVFASGDRLRVLATVLDAAPYYEIPPSVLDYEIVGSVQREMTQVTPSEEKKMGQYLKVRKITGSPTFAKKISIQVYTPVVRDSNLTQVFRSIGESYPVIVSGGISYHGGQIQNQSVSQPATFKFIDGGVYYKFRDFYVLKDDGTIDTETGIYSRGVMDRNYSDFFSSAVNSQSTPWIIDLKAKRFKRQEVRFSEAFQPNTSINNLNRFYPANYVEVIIDNGQIRAMLQWNNGMVIFQTNKIGRMPVFEQIYTSLDGTGTIATSQKLLNRIQYYPGQCGVGEVPESIAFNNKSIYGWDNLRGVCWRISQNGLEFISVVHKINSFAVQEASKRGFANKIIGSFDSSTNKYISYFEAVGDSPAKTIVWREAGDKSGFEHFVDLYPEMMVCLNTLFIAFKSGQLYTHDSSVYNSFFGVNYGSSITGVFNDYPAMKKSFGSITLISGQPWAVPLIQTDVNANPTGVKQQTAIKEGRFLDQEGEYSADVPPNAVAPDDGVNGAPMKGRYAIVKFQKQSAQNFIFLMSGILSIIDSPKNPT